MAKTKDIPLGGSIEKIIKSREERGTAKPQKPKTVPKEDRIKATLYIYKRQMFALEDIRRKRIEGGADPGTVDKSKLMREAVDLLIKKEKV